MIEKIDSGLNLKKLKNKELTELSGEIREFLIDKVEKRGGHLASNLGVVELTLAIHRVFDIPKDRLIFDVGHQSYVHKILTGRMSGFDELRTPGGLSGFTSIKESEADAFGAGHSSTAISAALGFAQAGRINKEKYHTVCVVGDGAYTGGMVHEALNNCNPDLPLVIILNENGMSISNNKGAFAKYISRVRVSQGYVRWKSYTNLFLSKIPFIGNGIKKLLSRIKGFLKGLVYPSNYFEDIGLYYIGPIDGHNQKKLEAALKTARRLGKSCVVHVKTQKGKGYSPAENSPDEYHSIGSSNHAQMFHEVAAAKLTSLAGSDKSIVAITAAMAIGTSLDMFEKAYPDRFFDVGIAEEHAVTFSAGLAAAGLSPYFGVYSTFLQRGYDNLVHDVCLQELPVRLLIDRAGLSAADGPTHHGIFDVSFISAVPNISLYAPVTFGTLEDCISSSTLARSAFAIRYANTSESERIKNEFFSDGDGKIRPIRTSFKKESAPEYVFISYGNITERVLLAQDILKEKGYSVGTILVEQIKPYEPVVEEIYDLIKNSKRVLYVEEGIKNGGAAMITGDILMRLGFLGAGRSYVPYAIDDTFVTPDVKCDIYEYAGFSPEMLASKMIEEK